MIYSGSSSIGDVKYGSQQIGKAYYGSDLVWNKSNWVEYEFPNNNAYFNGPGGMYGFTSARAIEDTGATVYAGEARMLNNVQSDCMRVSTLGDQWITVDFTIPDDWNDARLTSFRTDGTAISNTVLPSWINVYVSPASEQIGDSGQFVRVKQLGSSTNPPISDVYSVSDFASGFNPATICKTLRIRFMHSSTSTTRKTVRSGNFYFKFLIKKNALTTWATNYNVALT